MRLNILPDYLSSSAKWRRKPLDRKGSGWQSLVGRSSSNQRCFRSIEQGQRREGPSWSCRGPPLGACSAHWSSGPLWWLSSVQLATLGRLELSSKRSGSVSRSSWAMDDLRWWDSVSCRWREACTLSGSISDGVPELWESPCHQRHR